MPLDPYTAIRDGYLQREKSSAGIKDSKKIEELCDSFVIRNKCKISRKFSCADFGVNLPSMLVCLGWRSWKMTISPDDGIIPVRAVMFTW